MLARILVWLRARTLSLGERGERAAARFLRRTGYQIIARHYRDRYGEIDVIATDGRALIFVEVKTRRSAQHDHPAESVDLEKQRRLTRTALAYVKRHRLATTPVRFDIIAVTWPTTHWRPTIEHFPGAFRNRRHLAWDAWLAQPSGWSADHAAFGCPRMKQQGRQ